MSEKIEPHVFKIQEWRKLARTFVDAGRAAMARVAKGQTKAERDGDMAEMRTASNQLHGIIGFDPIHHVLEALDRLDNGDEKWKAFKSLAGYVQNGSDTVVSLFWDDATRTAHIQVGKRTYYGSSFDEALDKAMVDHKED